MSEFKGSEKWLTHLPPQVITQAGGQLMDSYSIALEGWRRGLELTFHSHQSPAFADMPKWFVHKPGKLFSLSSGSETHYFFRSRGDKVNGETVIQAADKAQAKKYLEAAGVPVPRGIVIDAEESADSLKRKGKELDYPLVVKITNGSFGRGIVTNLRTEEAAAEAIDQVRKEYPEETLIIEEHLAGPEYRLYAVGDQVAGAIERQPANVTGDGVSTIRTLIAQKNQMRKRNPRLADCPIVEDKEIHQVLAKQQLSLDAVPPKDQRIFLRDRSNISLGGDPVDRLEEIPESMKAAAVQALKAFPDFPHGAVDIIWSSHGPAVIEVNPTAQLGSLLYPDEGKSRDIPKAIIDYYFPESSNTYRASHWYFDIHQALIPLETGAAEEVRVTPCEKTKALEGKHWLLQGKLDSLLDKEKLRETAIFYRMAGFLREKDKNHFHLYLTGEVKGYAEVIAFLHQAGMHSDFLADAPAFVTSTFQIEETNKEKKRLIKELQVQTKLVEKQRRAKERLLHIFFTLSKGPLSIRQKFAARGK